MPSLKPLGLAAALTLFSACAKPAEKPEVVSAACERFRAAIAMEGLIEQMAVDPAAWKLFPAPLAEAAWEDAHAETTAALKEVKDQGACLRKIREGKQW